jgi:putative membrane protein
MRTMTRMTILRGGALAALLLSPAMVQAADPPATNEVLGKLHQSNQKEIEMGKLAQKNGSAKEVKAFGAMLVKDHSAADKKVLALAKKEKVDLPTPAKPASSDDMSGMAKGSAFDEKFARDMLDDHKKDIAEATAARDSTNDEKLKKLLTDIVPTLQKHEDTAQKLVDSQKK